MKNRYRDEKDDIKEGYKREREREKKKQLKGRERNLLKIEGTIMTVILLSLPLLLFIQNFSTYK